MSFLNHVQPLISRKKPQAPPVPAFEPWSSFGYCHCCRTNTEFHASESFLREFYKCVHCQSIPRHRHLQMVLDMYFPGWEDLHIHESSPAVRHIAQYAKHYSSSQLLPGIKPGETAEGMLCQDLENLTFADNTFDLFITQDVMEHVFHPDRAIAEIHRVLKPGGAHIFTAPKHKGLLATVQRARLAEDGSVVHMLPEMYHGNPVGDGRALVTWDYGYDFEELLSDWSGSPVQTFRTRDHAKGIDAMFNEVFVIRKPTRIFQAATMEPASAAELGLVKQIKTGAE
jgi:SAM-dependent methyltransferase